MTDKRNPGALAGATGTKMSCHAIAADTPNIAQTKGHAKEYCAAAALEYAEHGWHVFPARIKDGSKRSYIAGKANGGERWGATSDSDTIRRYWQHFPDALLGITTGQDSGLFVIDADSPEGHAKDGIGVLRGWIEEYGDWPDTIEADTPSGGRHVYFRCPADLEIRNSQSKLAPGIDVRGEGGMVLAPPTIKPGTDKAYRWRNPPSEFDLAECPKWLLDKIRATQAAKLSAPDMPGADGQIAACDANAWADKALQGELAKLLAATEGKRNAALNTAAFRLGQMAAGGGLDEGTVRDRLTGAAAAIGLEPEEIAATIKSGFEAGKQTPRARPERATTTSLFMPEGPRPLVREVASGEAYPVTALGPLRPAVEAVQGMTQAPVAIRRTRAGDGHSTL